MSERLLDKAWCCDSAASIRLISKGANLSSKVLVKMFVYHLESAELGLDGPHFPDIIARRLIVLHGYTLLTLQYGISSFTSRLVGPIASEGSR